MDLLGQLLVIEGPQIEFVITAHGVLLIGTGTSGPRPPKCRETIG
jgi:hypothetical protein